MPQVGQLARGIPGGPLAPFVLHAVSGPFENSTADAAVEHDELGPPGHGVVAWPPRVDARGPHLEGTLGRAVDIEGEPQRRSHCLGLRSTFSASSRNRTAASPQIPSRYAWTARSPSSWRW